MAVESIFHVLYPMHMLGFLSILFAATLALNQVAVADEVDVKIGVCLALTGSLAEYGEAVRNGIELARLQHPEYFKNVEFIYEDDAYDPKKAVLNFRKFTTIDKINFMFAWGAEPSLTLAPIAEREKFAIITQSPLVSISRNRSDILRFQYNDDKHGLVLTEYLKNQGIKRIGMIMSEGSFFQLLSNGIEKHLKDDQSYTVITSVLPSETDFRSILIRKDLKNYDITGVYLFPGQLRIFYRQMHELGLNFRTFGTTTFESTSILQDVLPLIEGVPYTHSATSDEFLKEYVRYYGNNMHAGYAAGCYDFAMLAGKLATSGKITAAMNGLGIIDAFKQVKPFSGASGNIKLIQSKEDGTYFDFDIAVKKFVAGKIVTEFKM